MQTTSFDDLAPGFAGVTESVARAVVPFSGKGRKDDADHTAVEAMRAGLAKLPARLHILLGEGEKDNAPMLYTGERFGAENGPRLDLIVDPLECTTNFSKGLSDSMSVILAVPEGTAREVPGSYMVQLLLPPGAGAVASRDALDAAPADLLPKVASSMGLKVSDITVVVQDRPRHELLVKQIRQTGAGVSLIDSGSISAAVEIALVADRLTILWGTFGAPEGLVIAFLAAMTRSHFFGRIAPHDAASAERADSLALSGRTLTETEWVSSDGLLSMSGIHASTWLSGVRRGPHGRTRVETVVVCRSGVSRMVHEDGTLTGSRAFA